MRPDQKDSESIDAHWALGFGTTARSPSRITLDSDPLYRDLIEKDEPRFIAETSENDVDRTRRGETKAKMLVPIKTGSIVLGAINVEYRRKGFYGREEKTSADFALLKSVALEVGQALQARRTRCMLRELLVLHRSIGAEKRDHVIERLIHILYDYTGCAVGIWMEPNSASAIGWHVRAVWECAQGYRKSEPVPKIFATDHLKPTQRLVQWQQYLSTNFEETQIYKWIDNESSGSGSEIVFYIENETTDDDMGIKSRSQLLLALRDPETKKLQGIFSLLFNQKPGLDEKRQAPILREAAEFAANYLSIQNKNHAYLMHSQMMEQQVALGMAYQQLRHSLKLKLGGINGILDSLLRNLGGETLDCGRIDEQIVTLKGFMGYIAKDIDMSRSLLSPPELIDLDLKSIWKWACEQFMTSAQKAAVTILPMEHSIWVHADANIVKMMFSNLIDNAIEALAKSEKSGQIECLPLANDSSKPCRVAVRDSGSGVPMDIAERLFKEIGVSDKPSGTGFGTYFSAFMLEKSGAHIELDQSWQKGAQFILSFPLRSNGKEDK